MSEIKLQTCVVQKLISRWQQFSGCVLRVGGRVLDLHKQE